MRKSITIFLALILFTPSILTASPVITEDNSTVLPKRIEQWQPNVCRVKAFSKSSNQSMGSGVYMGCGVILTCNHLFSDRVTHFEVTFHGDSQVYRAERNGTDKKKDIGFLLVSPAPDTKDRRGVILNDTPLEVGDIVWQAGYGSDNRLFWHRSKINNFRRHWILTSRHARLGDSGGPVFTDSGQLAGNLWGRGETARTTWFNKSSSIVDALGHDVLNLLDVNHAQCNKDGCYIDGVFYRKGSRNNSNQPDGGGIYSPNNKRRIKNILQPLNQNNQGNNGQDPFVPKVPPLGPSRNLPQPHQPQAWKKPEIQKPQTKIEKIDEELELLKKEQELKEIQELIKAKEIQKERDIQLEKEAAIAKEVAKSKAVEEARQLEEKQLVDIAKQKLAEEKRLSKEDLPESNQKEEKHEDHELTVSHTIDDFVNDRGFLHVLDMVVLSYFGVGIAGPIMFAVGILLTWLFKSGYLTNRRWIYGKQTEEDPGPKGQAPEGHVGDTRGSADIPGQHVRDSFSSVRNRGVIEKVKDIHTEITELKTNYKESMDLKQAELDQLNKDTKELDSIQNLKVDKTGS
jgi:S1-C subfamily serine protease